jgi:hypothetical protein
MTKTLRPLISAVAAWMLLTSGAVVGRQVAKPVEPVKPNKVATNPLNDALEQFIQHVGAAAAKGTLPKKPPKPAPVAVPIARLARPGLPPLQDQAAVLKELTDMFTPRLRPFVRAELHFIRLVCDPTTEQRRALTRDAEIVLQDVVKQMAGLQATLQQQGWNGEPFLDHEKLIRDGMAKSVNAHLSPEQRAGYAAEAAQRDAVRRAAVIETLVFNLERELVLSTDQRCKLIENLTTNWDNAWCVCLYQPNFQNGTSFPLPNPCVVPVLSKGQVEIWQGLVKPQLMYYGVRFGPFESNGDDLPLDEDFPAQDEPKPGPTE